MIELIDRDLSKLVQKYRRHRGDMTDANFGFGVTIGFIATVDSAWDRGLEELKFEEMEVVLDHFERDIRPKKYMPFPASFLVDQNDEKLAAEVTLELRPRYEELETLLLSLKQKLTAEGD